MDLNTWTDQMYEHSLDCERCSLGTNGAVASSHPLLDIAIAHQLARLELTPLMSR